MSELGELISKKRMLEKLGELQNDQFFNVASIRNFIREEPEAVVRCRNCKHYKPSDVAKRWMCFRKDVDGIPVCYDFLPNDFCSYGERKEE